MSEESDWPDRGCITTVENEEYGNRDFFIMNTADGSWWCWPINAEKDPSISAIENISPELAAQAYTNKANIPNGNAIKIKPAYPSWCLVNENPIFKNVWESDKTKTNQPRYSWSFNSTGTKAISVMIEKLNMHLFLKVLIILLKVLMNILMNIFLLFIHQNLGMKIKKKLFILKNVLGLLKTELGN